MVLMERYLYLFLPMIIMVKPMDDYYAFFFPLLAVLLWQDSYAIFFTSTVMAEPMDGY